MKIIIEGTERELRNALRSFGVSDKVAVDDGTQFLCGDMVGRGHRRKAVEHAFTELKAKSKNKLNGFFRTKRVERPYAVEYAERELPKFPDKVSDQTIVDIQQLYKAVENIPPDISNRTISNLKLSELIYLFANENKED